MAGEYGENRKRNSESGLYAGVIAAALILAVLLCMAIFFKVNEITVTGNSLYTDEQVLKASGIEIGDSIFFIQDSPAAARIKQKLSYADDVQIIRQYPDRVVIELTESVPLASVNAAGKWWIVDKNARVLDETDEAGAAGTIQLRGLEAASPSVGRTLDLGDGSATKMKYLTETLSALMTSGLYEQVHWLDMTNIANISFDYKDYIVKVGKGEKVLDKLQTLQGFLREYGDEGKGILDASDITEVHKRPLDDG